MTSYHDLTDEAREVRRKAYKCWGPVALALFAIVLGLTLGSFSRMEYYSQGFSKSNLTGKVDRSKVYEGGTYWTGVSKSFITFPANAIQESLKDLSVFTASTSENAVRYSIIAQRSS